MSRLFPTPQKHKAKRKGRESRRKRAWEKFPLFAPHLILVVVGHKSFYFDTIAAFPAAVLLLVPFGTFSPYLEPKLFTIDPHFLNHKITKRRALMFALWTSLVKCPKVHKSLTEKRGVFPTSTHTFWHGLRPPKKLLGKRVNNAKSCRAKQQGKFSLCHLFSFYLFLLHPISPAWCEPFSKSSFWGQIPFKFLSLAKNLIKSRKFFFRENIHHDVWMAIYIHLLGPSKRAISRWKLPLESCF